MSEMDQTPLSAEELAAESGTALPAKEVMSLLDLNADLNLGLDVAAPIDLAVAANANVAAPIDAAVSANVLSLGSTSGALAGQHVAVDQGITGDAVAHAPQDSSIDQTGGATHTGAGVGGTGPTGAVTDGATTGAAGTTDAGSTVGSTAPADTSSALNGDLLHVDVNAAADAKLAAPIAGAVAANANVAAPIDASVSANIGSVDSASTAIADQTAVISQHMDGVTADATADQTSHLNQ